MTHRCKPAAWSAAALLCLAATPGPAAAGASGSAALTSDYLFRGISQTNGDPALQAGIEYAADNGFYAGAWGSNASWLSDLSSDAAPISSSLEFDVYAGYRGAIGEAATFDLAATWYAYPGDFPASFNRADTGELSAAIGFKPSAGTSLGAKYAHAVTDLFGYPDSDGSGYLELNAGWEFHPGWTVAAQAGHQRIRHNGAYDYTQWRVGLARAFANGFSVAAAWSDTDAERALYTNPQGHHLGDATLVLTLAKAF